MEKITLHTSYHAKASELRKQGFLVVSISVHQPKWARPGTYDHIEKRLAPYSYMLKSSQEDYDIEFEKILAKISPGKVLNDLQLLAKKHGKEKIALLCYEKDVCECHRGRVAEWFQEKLGMEVGEVVFPEKVKSQAKDQLTLF